MVSAAALLEGKNVPAVELLERAMTFSNRQIFQDAICSPPATPYGDYRDRHLD